MKLQTWIDQSGNKDYEGIETVAAALGISPRQVTRKLTKIRTPKPRKPVPYFHSELVAKQKKAR